MNSCCSVNSLCIDRKFCVASFQTTWSTRNMHSSSMMWISKIIHFVRLSHDTMHTNYFEIDIMAVPRNSQLAGIQKGLDSEKANHLVSCMSGCQLVKRCNITQPPSLLWPGPWIVAGGPMPTNTLHSTQKHKKNETVYIKFKTIFGFLFSVFFRKQMQMIEFIFHHFPLIFVPSHFEWSWMWMTARPLMPHPLLLPWRNATAANSVSWRQTKWFTNPMMQFLIYPTCQNLVIFCYSNTRYSCLLINRRQFNKVSYIFHVRHLHHICHDKKKLSLHNSNIPELTVFLLWYKLYNTFCKKKRSLCSQIFSGKWQLHLGKHLKRGRTEPPNTSRSCHVPLHFLLPLKFVVVFCLVLVLSWFTDLLQSWCAQPALFCEVSAPALLLAAVFCFLFPSKTIQQKKMWKRVFFVVPIADAGIQPYSQKTNQIIDTGNVKFIFENHVPAYLIKNIATPFPIPSLSVQTGTNV